MPSVVNEPKLPKPASCLMPPGPGKLPYVFELWSAARLPPKPRGQPGVQYGTGAAWALAVRPPKQSAANTTARANLPGKTTIRATTANCPEIVPARYQERQC